MELQTMSYDLKSSAAPSMGSALGRTPLKIALALFFTLLVYNVVLFGANEDLETGMPAERRWPHGELLETRFESRIKRPRNQTPVDEAANPPRRKNEVVIYAATKFFRMDVTTARFLSECYSTKGLCRLSEDPRDEPIADAVLFHNADYLMATAYRLSTPRKIHVLWSLESPDNDAFRPEPHMINWTMTPRRDADVWYPYGHFEQLPEKKEVDLEKIWTMKTQSVPATWLASNCFARNQRSALIAALEKEGLKIDRWGGCGRPPPNCAGVDKQGYDCVIQLIKPYKFYIAFENTNCKDYVTEKFYETLRSRMAVPIVIHRKYYEDLKAPGNAFIALDDFKSIQELAKFVTQVADNKTEYLKYHEWRRAYQVLPEHHDSTGFCELCRRLQNPVTTSKSYADVRGWNSNGICHSDSSMKFLASYNPLPQLSNLG